MIGGFRPWLLQRLTAVYLLVFIVAFGGALLWGLPWDAARWRAFLGWPPVLLAVTLFYLALFLHAWIGVRDVIVDYVHPLGLRLAALSLAAAGLLAMAFWMVLILTQVMP